MPFIQTSNKKRILGIDPGIATTGFGIVETNGYDTICIEYGVIQTPAKTLLAKRLVEIQKTINNLLIKYKPDYVGVEKIFFAKNTKTAIDVAHARGVLLLTVEQHNIQCIELTPRQIKLSLTGFGEADKKQIQLMVQNILKLKQTPTPDDAADALAIAICTSQNALQIFQKYL